MKKLTLILGLCALCLVNTFAWGAEPSSPAFKLTAQDHTDIQRVEAFLNAMKSIRAGFTQINDNGTMLHGAMAIERPGKMRVTYDPPNQDFIIADGSLLHMWDGEMQQQSNVPLGSSIASLLLRDHIKMSGDVSIVGITRPPSKIEVTLVSASDPDEGQLTLVFEDHPLKLRQWRVLDAQGHVTTVSLENAQDDVTFPSGTFDFIPPNIGKTGRNVRK